MLFSNIQKGITKELPPTATLKCKVHQCDVLNIWDVKQILCVIFKINCASLQTLETPIRKKLSPLYFSH